MRLAALSVDLDEIGCYAAIHGLEAPGRSGRAIYDKALPRLRALFASEGVPCTFFAIGRDLDRDNGARLRMLAEEGHEIANHSLDHLYDLTRRDRATITREIAGGMEAIERTVGVVPLGFRAPGYTITDAVFEVLEELGVAYDSSVFPCPAYYLAKTGAIGAIRLRGRRSRSVVDDPRVLSAPADPYRVGTPYWRRGDGVLELPIGVSRGPRLPYIGTSVVLSGETGAAILSRAIVGRPLVNLELHGIDLADAEEDGLGWLRPHQPDLAKSAQAKERALRSAIGTLRDAGYRFVTLGEAAEAFAGSSAG
ncbi:MAG: polysaccharide deacetylase family protein [Sandaracinaceae bacterium]|nr:polysaccharide deacetylase [Myxococcales bacterium]